MAGTREACFVLALMAILFQLENTAFPSITATNDVDKSWDTKKFCLSTFN